MQFFLLDFTLAFVALLAYRALAAVTRDRVPAVSLAGRPNPLTARNPGITRRDCESTDGMTCGERPSHRLINFW